MLTLLRVLALLLLPAAALACEPQEPGSVDRPVRMFTDGSFVDGASDDAARTLRGRPVTDLGQGRVVQVVESVWDCEVELTMVFVDCGAGEGVAIAGLRPHQTDLPVETHPELGLPITGSVRALAPPWGPVDLTADTTVREVYLIGLAHDGWWVSPDLLDWSRGLHPRNSWNPFVSCRYLYPGSAGAGI